MSFGSKKKGRETTKANTNTTTTSNNNRSEDFSASLMVEPSNAFRTESTAVGNYRMSTLFDAANFRHSLMETADSLPTAPRGGKVNNKNTAYLSSDDDDLYIDETTDNDLNLSELMHYPSEVYEINGNNGKNDASLAADAAEPTKNNRQESLAINVHIIDQLMDRDDSEDPPGRYKSPSLDFPQQQQKQKFIYEDSEDLLSQLHSALDANPVVQHPGPKTMPSSRTIIEGDVETERLEKQLEQSNTKKEILKEKLARIREKEKALKEIDDEINDDDGDGDGPSREILEKILKMSSGNKVPLSMAGGLSSEAQKDLTALNEATEKFRISLEQADLQVGEIIEQRNRLQEQQEQIESLEQERNFHTCKIAELAELLKMNNENEMQDHLTQKSMLVAQLDQEVASLRQKLNKSQAAKAIENPTDGFGDMGGVIPQNHALEATIASLQNKIEELELEKSQYMDTVEDLMESVSKLSNENEMRQVKITAAENEFLELNQQKKNKPVDITQEKLLRFKAWANTKITKAQAQYQTIKHDLELRQVTTNPDQILSQRSLRDFR